jgi:hypothetical protein
MYSSTHSLTLTLDGGEWSASRPSRFTSRGVCCILLNIEDPTGHENMYAYETMTM